MKLEINHVGKIENAVVELNGITVLAGENNSGKTTIGKALFAIAESFVSKKDKIAKMRKDSCTYSLVNSASFGLSPFGADFHNAVNQAVIAYDEFLNKEKPSDTDIENYINRIVKSRPIPPEKAKEASSMVKEYINITEQEWTNRIINENFTNKFNKRINDVFSSLEAVINLTGKDGEWEVSFSNDTIKNYSESGSQNACPFELKPIGREEDDNFLKSIFKQLSRHAKTTMGDRILINQRLGAILNIINDIFNWKEVSENGVRAYEPSGTTKSIPEDNISDGVKAFIALKDALNDGLITDGSILILDEPEINLHPQWQLKYAQLIVLLTKEFGTKTLLATHSPYFLRAIQMYSAKYEIADKCKYYLTTNHSRYSKAEDVTTNTDKIYRLLLNPFEELENLLDD